LGDLDVALTPVGTWHRCRPAATGPIKEVHMSAQWETLREQVRGTVIGPGDAGYDEARTVRNGMIDKRPAVVVRAANAGDVMTAVRFAADNGLSVAVRGGAHSVPGFGTADDAVVVDLSEMRGGRVDPRARTVRVGGGATWGDLNAMTYPFGLATTGGIISTTGVGGLTLGGGIGYLTRSLGLALDNLLSADVVTADGTFHVASEKDDADLFWAIRGGGGNFGVVTSFEFRLSPVKDIYGGPMFFELDAAGDLLRLYREFIADAPEQFGGFPAFQIAPPLPFIPEERHGKTLALMVTCWSGDADQGEKVLKPFRDLAPAVAELVGPMPYPALNSAFDDLYPSGLRHYWKANFVKELTDEAIAAHVEHGSQVPEMTSTVHIYPINGACQRVAPDATAFAYRDANFATVIAGMWPDEKDDERNIAWVRDYYDAIAPLSEEGGYVNFMAEDDQSRIAVNYRDNYDRLRQIKGKYDPGNLFRHNQNIPPA
jgi:FAD/FMN-containing dehydrogenase